MIPFFKGVETAERGPTTRLSVLLGQYASFTHGHKSRVESTRWVGTQPFHYRPAVGSRLASAASEFERTVSAVGTRSSHLSGLAKSSRFAPRA